MKSFAMALDLRDDADTIERYKAYHRAVWGEVLDGLRALGICKMKIFLRGNRLFMYLEAPDEFDPERDFPLYYDLNRHVHAEIDRLEEVSWRHLQTAFPVADFRVGVWGIEFLELIPNDDEVEEWCWCDGYNCQ